MSAQLIARRGTTNAFSTTPAWCARDRDEPRTAFHDGGRRALRTTLELFPGRTSGDSETAIAAQTQRAFPAGTSVLIVDSFADEGEMYAEYLRTGGAVVDYVRTPEQALSGLPALSPAVIVTDMVFLGSQYDGPAFMRAVREIPACAVTSCIMVSGYPRAVDRQRARAAGVDLFVLKPCMPNELQWHIQRAVSAYRRHARAEWNWPD